MNLQIWKCALLACGVIACSADAASRQTPDIHVGAGTMSCGEWLLRRAEERAHGDSFASAQLLVFMTTSWIQGYVFGLMVSKQDMKFLEVIPDVHSINAWVDKHCTDHPIDKTMDSGMALYHELLRRAAP